jgi:CheY-like chemotaxis protein
MEKPKVVVVDDDTDFLEEIEEVLRSKGYAVKTVSDPFAAIQVIKTTRPDAIMLDLQMNGKDGFQIAGELSGNAETAKIPVIAMTGYYTEDELRRLKESGVVRSFLTKPLAIPDVVAMLDEVQGTR